MKYVFEALKGVSFNSILHCSLMGLFSHVIRSWHNREEECREVMSLSYFPPEEIVSWVPCQFQELGYCAFCGFKSLFSWYLYPAFAAKLLFLSSVGTRCNTLRQRTKQIIFQFMHTKAIQYFVHSQQQLCYVVACFDVWNIQTSVSVSYTREGVDFLTGLFHQNSANCAVNKYQRKTHGSHSDSLDPNLVWLYPASPLKYRRIR